LKLEKNLSRITGEIAFFSPSVGFYISQKAKIRQMNNMIRTHRFS